VKDFSQFGDYKVVSELFSYGWIGPEQTARVLEAYQEVQSCLAASLREGIYVSPATVSRVVRAAVTGGVLEPRLKRERGRPRDLREKAKEIMQTFPQEWGYTASQQAAIVGCSVDTIFEARHEMDE